MSAPTKCDRCGATGTFAISVPCTMQCGGTMHYNAPGSMTLTVETLAALLKEAIESPELNFPDFSYENTARWLLPQLGAVPLIDALQDLSGSQAPVSAPPTTDAERAAVVPQLGAGAPAVPSEAAIEIATIAYVGALTEAADRGEHLSNKSRPAYIAAALRAAYAVDFGSLAPAPSGPTSERKCWYCEECMQTMPAGPMHDCPKDNERRMANRRATLSLEPL